MDGSRLLYGYVVERRARNIRDPIEKLRFLRSSMQRRSSQPANFRRLLLLPAFAACCIVGLAVKATVSRPPDRLEFHTAAATLPAAVHDVWLVEQKNGIELYSNGLRVDNRYATPNQPRSYGLFQGRAGQLHSVERRVEPAGIVFHTTESLLAPFAPGYNDTLQRLGQELLVSIRAHRSYHFLIDRFGRVYRVVYESDSANHAGHSVWADEKWKYINLNHSFLGVSFETQTRAGSEPPTISPAQIDAGRILTEMLRSKYRIPARNCVTHAQVSVNAGKMLVGYHTDWAANFPFSKLGLPDNYLEPLPSLYAFGFEYDSTYLKATGVPVWGGLIFAKEQLRRDALSAGLGIEDYRKLLRHSYRNMIAASRESDAHNKESD